MIRIPRDQSASKAFSVKGYIILFSYIDLCLF